MKINFKQIGKALTKFGKRIAPAAAIAAGVTCTAVAAYKTAKAVPVAREHIVAKELELDKDKLTIKETFEACAKDFAGPALLGVTGIAAVAAGICDYEKSIKNLGAAVGVTSALLREQSSEMQKTLGEVKASDIQNKAVENVTKSTIGAGARIITPGGSDIFVEEATGREYLSSEAWIRECFSKYMDDFIDNPDDRPSLNVFYDLLAPNVKKSGAPIANYLTFPYDTSKSARYNRVELSFEPTETVDGKAAFMWRYSRPLECAHIY